MTYLYGALAMLCFALTYLYAMFVVFLFSINARLNSRFLSPFVFHIFYFSVLLSLASPAFFHASLYLIRFIASTIPEHTRYGDDLSQHLDTPSHV